MSILCSVAEGKMAYSRDALVDALDRLCNSMIMKEHAPSRGDAVLYRFEIFSGEDFDDVTAENLPTIIGLLSNSR